MHKDRALKILFDKCKSSRVWIFITSQLFRDVIWPPMENLSITHTFYPEDFQGLTIYNITNVVKRDL